MRGRKEMLIMMMNGYGKGLLYPFSGSMYYITSAEPTESQSTAAESEKTNAKRKTENPFYGFIYQFRCCSFWQPQEFIYT